MPEAFEHRLKEALAARTPERTTVEDARAAAVLIPIVEASEPTLILTVRTDTVGTHKGQISFPGGSVDASDDSRVQAALRETHEEIGLDPSSVRVLGELDTFPTFVSGYVVTPFVGWLERPPDLRANPAEVAEVLHVPISHLTEEIRAEPGFSHEGRSYPTEAWIWRGHVIWGVTARIVRHFLSVLAEAGLAATPGRTASWTAWPLQERR
ncbi:MAG: CoA pyrophosphatase [Actinomycetota bacterium]